MKITKELLKNWKACQDGFARFCELFPKGADLNTAIEALVKDGHDNWAKWLFDKCKDNNLFSDIVQKGYRNSGDYNSGYRNSGDYNSGYYNSGYYNSGDYNSGYCNSGDCNSGDYNSGYCNSGNRNSGYCNSGYCNSGNRNSGDYNSGYCNSGNRNSGIFCNIEPPQTLFNKPTDLMFDSLEIQRIISVINSVKPVLTWISSENMSEEEKKDNPSHETTGGFLRARGLKYCWQKSWDKFTKEQKNIILNAPNFDAEIFKDITGIDV